MADSVNQVLCSVYCSCFVKKSGTAHKISILQRKPEGGIVLHMAYALRGRMSPTCQGYS